MIYTDSEGFLAFFIAPGKMKKVARVFVEWDKKISEESLHNADLFFEIKTKLSRYDCIQNYFIRVYFF